MDNLLSERAKAYFGAKPWLCSALFDWWGILDRALVFFCVFRELLLPAIRTGRSHRFTSRGPIFWLYLYSLDGEFLPQLGLTLPEGIPWIFEPILTFRLVFRLSNSSVDWFVWSHLIELLLCSISAVNSMTFPHALRFASHLPLTGWHPPSPFVRQKCASGETPCPLFC